ncbi:MAG: ABC transporter ATP-binding protein [Thermodesulfobacteriota bacterium]
MSDVAIRIENLGKQYKIGKREKYYTLRDSLTRFLSNPFRRNNGNGALDDGSEDHIWALKDVSLEIKRGEVIGIIGRNGAGKSTLLKILSRITEPTEGRAEIFGRVGSLLEVGTGFHPELTGRENIYLNGAILGMRKAEIQQKFDEIVTFAEVEKFLDTPVKHYSSGMYVRLAFAVAAHLDPEILLVDEVLAVGDAAFQNKCLGKMKNVASEGRTVLFVSHNMSAISNLCERSILLDHGKNKFDGESQSVIDRYLSLFSDNTSSIRSMISATRSGIGGGKIERLEIETSDGRKTNILGIGDALCVKIYAKIIDRLPSIVVGLELKTDNGTPILNLRSDSNGQYFGPYKEGTIVLFTFNIPSLPFYPGSYLLEPWFGEKKGKRIDHVHEPISIVLEPIGKFKSEAMIQKGRGLLMMDCEIFDTLLNST